MISIQQKKVFMLSYCLAALTPSGLAAMQTKKHSVRYFKQIRQLNKKSKPVLNYNQFVSQPDPIAIKQLQKFSKLQAQKPSIQKYEQKCMGQWVPKIGCTSPLFAILLASYFLVSQVDPMKVPIMATQISAATARLLAQQVLEAQRLAQLNIQQELEDQRLYLEQLMAQQIHKEQQRREKQKKLEEQKKLKNLQWKKAKQGPKIPFQDFNLNDKPIQISQPKRPAVEQQFAVPEKTETKVAVAFTDKQHLAYYCSLLEIFTIKADTIATLKQLVGKTTTTQQLLAIKHKLDHQYLLLSWFKASGKYRGRAQNLKQGILNILLTNNEFSLTDVLDLAQKLIAYTSFIRNALFMTCELPSTIEERKKETLKKSSQLLAKVKDISVPQNSPAAAFKMFAQDDLEKSISDVLTTGGIAYAKGVNKLTEQLLKGIKRFYDKK